MKKTSLKAKIKRSLRNEKSEREVSELLWAQIFHDTIRGGFLEEKPFAVSPGRWAAGYNYFYVVYRILNEVRPKSLLEFGLGQSSKLTGRYLDYVEKNGTEADKVSQLIIEHDKQFGQAFFRTGGSDVREDHVRYVEMHDTPKLFLNGTVQYYYDESSLEKWITNHKFDFISIDGPFGSDGENAYSRIDILKYLPECLCDTFCIVMDDVDRAPEMKTAMEIMRILEAHHIKYRKGRYRSATDLMVIASEDIRFVCTM